MENWVDDEVARRWASFPTNATPRPIVMVDSRVRVEGGFIDGDSKSAWLEGAIEPGASRPPAVLALLPPRDPGRAQTVLTITDCVPTIAVFRCDRGPRELPAYRLSVTGLRGGERPPNTPARRMAGEAVPSGRSVVKMVGRAWRGGPWQRSVLAGS